MNILIVGSGGREHAIAWALRKSPQTRHRDERFQKPCGKENLLRAGKCGNFRSGAVCAHRRNGV